MRRRDFIASFAGAAAAWPLAARAQQDSMPVVGVIRSTSADDATNFLAYFSEGLREFGYVAGRNVTIDYRSVPIYEQLTTVAAELVRNKVAVIVASGAVNAPLAARTATATIPIVFIIGSDPVERGLVASLNRPGGNVAGVTLIGGQLIAKRVEMIREMAPKIAAIGFLVNPNNPNTEPEVKGMEDLARMGGWALHVVAVRGEDNLDSAFTRLAELGCNAFLHSSDILFSSRYPQMIALAARYKLVAFYTRPEAVRAGGLVSYGANPREIYRLGGTFVGRILKGAKPADLPVQQPTRFEMAVNLKTAKVLGLEVPTTILLRADEVIE